MLDINETIPEALELEVELARHWLGDRDGREWKVSGILDAENVPSQITPLLSERPGRFDVQAQAMFGLRLAFRRNLPWLPVGGVLLSLPVPSPRRGVVESGEMAAQRGDGVATQLDPVAPAGGFDHGAA